VKGAFVMQP